MAKRNRLDRLTPPPEAVPPAGPPPVATGVDRDAGEPGPPVVRRPLPLQRLERLHEHVLHHFLRLLPVGEQETTEAPEPPGMTLEQRPELILATHGSVHAPLDVAAPFLVY